MAARGATTGWRLDKLLRSSLNLRANLQCNLSIRRQYRCLLKNRYQGAVSRHGASPIPKHPSVYCVQQLDTCRQSSFNAKHFNDFEDGGTEDNNDIELGSFERFNISKNVQESLRAQGIEYLFPVQYKTFEPTINGQDVVVQARTGTGKTLSFTLPLVEKLLRNPGKLSKYGRIPRVLVLTPTRELAQQVKEDFASLSPQVSVTCIYGGEKYERQVSAIQKGVDVIVGTPGRVGDLIRNDMLHLKDTEHVILDEVDLMLNLGFAEQVEEVIDSFYKQATRPQTMMYSATMPAWVKRTARRYLSDDFHHINLIGKQEEQTATTVEQYAIRCNPVEHAILIQDLIKVHAEGGRVMVFCSTKRECEELSAGHFGKEARCLHGDISQKVRTSVIEGFKKNHFKILVTTDVAARGLDVPDVNLVIQTAPPQKSSMYIHRVGRSGRAGKAGKAVLLYSKEDLNSVQACEEMAKTTFKHLVAPTLDELLESLVEDAENRLNEVQPSIAKKFVKRAEDILKEKGPIEAMCQALAVISEANKYANRSLLSKEPGKTALCYRGRGCRTVGNARFTLSRMFGVMNLKITDVELLGREWGAVFDVPSEDVDTLLEEFEKIKEEGQRLEKLDTLPQLKYSDFESVTSRYEGRPGSRYKSRPGSRYESRPGNRHESRPSSAYGRSSSQVNHSFGDRPRFSSPRRRPSYFEDDDDDDDDDNDIDNDNFQGGYNRRSNFRQQKPQNRGLYYSDLNDRYGRNNRY